MTENKKIYRKTTLGKLSAMLTVLALVLAIVLSGCEKEGSNGNLTNDSAVSTISSDIKDTGETTISGEDAQSKALSHAEIQKADADFSKVELKTEGTKKIYEVVFKASANEYTYVIDAESGKIVSFKKEAASEGEKDNTESTNSKVQKTEQQQVTSQNSEPVVIPQVESQDTVSKTESVNSTPTSDESISKDRAKSIALKHAGVKSADAKGLKVGLDIDDGVKHYDVEFNAKGYEYDYEIDAKSGEILKSNKEVDDDYVAPENTETNNKSSKISKSAAKKAAFKHAGVKESNAYDISAEYDTDNGVKLYEVEFKSGNYEYSYEIDAVSGKVLSHEKEYDD